MYTVLKLFQPCEGNRKADVAPGENEFDTPALEGQARATLYSRPYACSSSLPFPILLQFLPYKFFFKSILLFTNLIIEITSQ